MQLLDQAIALVLVHHEGEVEIVGSLADEIDLLLFEQRKGITQLVQDGADVAADQRHAGAGTNDAHIREPGKITLQLAQQLAVERIGRRVQRHGDVGFRGRHQVDGHAVFLEHREGVGHEPHLVPHAGAVQ